MRDRIQPGGGNGLMWSDILLDINVNAANVFLGGEFNLLFDHDAWSHI